MSSLVLDYEEPIPFRSVMGDELFICTCTTAFTWCPACSPVLDGTILIEKESRDRLIGVYSSDNFDRILLPSNTPLNLARFLDSYFQKPIIFVLSHFKKSSDYLGNFWREIDHWKEDDIRYFFQRLHPKWAEVSVRLHVTATCNNRILALTILLQRGIKFPDDYFTYDSDPPSGYSEMDEFIATERPNINRLSFLESVLMSRRPAIISRPFFEDLLPQLTDFGYICTTEDLEVFLERDLIPRTSDQLREFIESKVRPLDFVEILVKYWDPETYNQILTCEDYDQDFQLEFHVQVIISGKYIFSNEQITSNIYQVAQRIVETRLRDFGIKVKPAFHTL